MRLQEVIEVANALHKATQIETYFFPSPPEQGLVTGSWQDKLFVFEDCLKSLMEAVAKEQKIVMASNTLQYVWAAFPIRKGEAAGTIVVMGPVTYSHINEGYMQILLQRVISAGELPAQEDLHKIPIIPYYEFVHHVRMLNSLVGGKDKVAEEIFYLSERIHLFPPYEEWAGIKHWQAGEYHGTYHNEKMILQAVSRGDWRKLKAVKDKAVRGHFCSWDPLRQKKDEQILTIALVARALIEGGSDSELMLSLQDYYTQQIEAATNVVEADRIVREYYKDVEKRVAETKSNTLNPKIIDQCCKYISDHIMEKLTADKLAVRLGYHAYYLTAQFKKEMGMTINEYINRKKIMVAMDMLADPTMSVNTVSEKLNYCSPSYFGSVFKKYMGVTPREYQRKSE